MLQKALLSIVFALYPLLVYVGLRSGYLHWVAVGLCAFALWRAFVQRTRLATVSASCAVALAAAALYFNDAVALKLYPFAMNVAGFFGFLMSLQSVPAIEHFARLKVSDLPPSAVAHCRQMTQLWCVFFVLNGLIALDSALFRSEQWWALYNGAIAYGLIGLMFLFEWCVRRYRQAHDCDSK